MGRRSASEGPVPIRLAPVGQTRPGRVAAPIGSDAAKEGIVALGVRVARGQGLPCVFEVLVAAGPIAWVPLIVIALKIDHLEVVQGVVDGGIAVEEVVDEGLAIVELPAEFQKKWGEARWWWG